MTSFDPYQSPHVGREKPKSGGKCAKCGGDPCWTPCPLSSTYHYQMHDLNEAIELLLAAAGEDGIGAAVVASDRRYEPAHWLKRVRDFLKFVKENPA